ncbi:MAG: hypothetical protein QM713_06590 [Arachnia sp.]
MNGMKEPVVGLLIDVVGSRADDRRALHSALLAAASATNGQVRPLEPLHPTVADELQGIYPSLGSALAAWYFFRLELAPRWDVRCGLGGGEIEVIDERIQDGSAWWLAREAIDWVEEQARRKGYESARTAVRDERATATPAADGVVRLIDAHLARLRPGAVGTLRALLDGLDNKEAARRAGITASANSQRIMRGDLRPLADAIRAVGTLP